MKLALIQAIRGAAALAVVLLHLSMIGKQYFQRPLFHELFMEGFVGVDVFFVLSGFIIYFVHDRDLGSRDRARLRLYSIKRFIRIFPTYWASTLVALALLVAIGAAKETLPPLSASYVGRSLLLVSDPEPPILAVAWSLEHEIVFYVFFALLIACPRVVLKYFVFAWLVAIALASFGALDFTGHAGRIVFSNLNLEFLLGCLAGWLVPKKRSLTWMLPVGLALFAVGWGMERYFELRAWRPLVVGVPAFLILSGAVSMERTRSVRVPRLAAYLGDASYSIYLLHWPVIFALVQVATKLVRGGSSVTIHLATVVVGLAAIAICCGFHTFVEKPLLAALRARWLPG